MGFFAPSSPCLKIGRRRANGLSSADVAPPWANVPPSAAALGMLMMVDPHHMVSSFLDAHSIFSSTPPLLLSSSSAAAVAASVETTAASSALTQALQIIADVTTTTAPVPSTSFFPFLADQTAATAAGAVSDTASAEHLKVLMEEESLNSLGHDFLIFLAAAVVAEPLGKILNVTPVLLYLLFGAVAGPYGLSVFTSGTEVNSEIGDYGILFLLFVEGLNLSPERLKALGSFFSLGATQLLLSVGLIFFGLFFGGPFLLPFFQDVRVPIDPTVVTDLFRGPVVAFSIAAAGALSSSAFVLPILKEKGWEKGADGIAALSILLLQDLAVAPLLVIIPLIAGGSHGDMTSLDPVPLAMLIGKATLGFGGVLAVASILLRQIFQVVARFGSAQTFIAATLLVAAGMGIISDNFGLSSTTGAFAAGVLLAESGYRAQIEADIRPFEGILLGVFFVTAGASLDPQTVIEQWPTLLAGIGVFCAVKFGIVLAAGNFGLGLTRAEAFRVAILLAGGGEFAFVIFKLANNLGVLTEDLTKLLTASVVISMSLTPLFGEIAKWGSAFLEKEESAEEEAVNGSAVNGLSDFQFVEYDVKLTDDDLIRQAFQRFDEDGNGSISADELQQVLTKPGLSNTKLSIVEVQSVIARFDEDGDGSLQFEEFTNLWTAKRRVETAAIGSLPMPASKPISEAIVVCGYGEVSQQLCSSLGNDIPYVAFSRDPERIAQGVLNGARVVYGNGASPQLVRSVGIKTPTAIVVAYASESRCLEATLRLHEAFPATPIYVRATRLDRVDELRKAGATKVVVETRKAAQAFRKLVRLDGAIKNRVVKAVSELIGVHVDVPYSEDELTELAYLCDIGPEEIGQLYALFNTSLNRDENGRVQLAELRDELMRQRKEPVDDETLKDWMGCDEVLSKWVTGEASRRWVSFPDFVRFAADKL